MKAHDVSTNDLFELVGQNLDWFSPDGVHFNAKGKEAQAKQVAERVTGYLHTSGSVGRNE
jgi:lysophospholipase L1-like esterase